MITLTRNNLVYDFGIEKNDVSDSEDTIEHINEEIDIISLITDRDFKFRSIMFLFIDLMEMLPFVNEKRVTVTLRRLVRKLRKLD